MAAIPSLQEFNRIQRERERISRETAEVQRLWKEEKARAAQEEREAKNYWLMMRSYDAYFRPALQEFLATPYRLDPMRNPADAFGLWEDLTKRGIAVTPEYDKRAATFTVTITAQIPQGWKTGRKCGDTFAEALVLATWEIIGDDEI